MAVYIKNTPIISITPVTNGNLQSYYGNTDILEDNFVEFTDTTKTTIKLSSTKIDGLLISKASTTQKGKVWILG